MGLCKGGPFLRALFVSLGLQGGREFRQENCHENIDELKDGWSIQGWELHNGIVITTNLHQDQDQDLDQDLPLMFGNDVAGVINAGTAG